MGLFDTYEDVQLKAGPCELKAYRIGAKVPLVDGVYVAPEGVVVVLKGKFVAKFECLTDKWGGRLDPDDVVGGRNPVRQVIAAVEKRFDGK